ncbi:MAG: DUF1697 domain-containing protein [Planctomycetes bacterium]|nr:DUF1697 domain-containing protein [Planctomycetota bacterium]
MTTTCIALLRGINVGRAKRIAMADLRALVEKLGGKNVRTLLNSGNVVFDAADKASAGFGARLERALDAELGVASRVTVLTATELERIVAKNPLASSTRDPSKFLVAFFAAEPERATLAPLLARDWKPDALARGPNALYLWCSKGVLDSAVSIAVNRAFRDAFTARNWATVLKLQALAADGGSKPK